MSLTDPLPLARALIRRQSVTPRDEGALDVLGEALSSLGFTLERQRFGDVDNLYAVRRGQGRNLCFAGHTDVVPPGEGWSVDPFAGEVDGGMLIGRGAADMKAAIAAMVASVARADAAGEETGTLSFLITGDEEGPAVDGTVRMLDWLAARGERLDACVVGEPTSVETVGDVVKNGRRGSLNVVLTAEGRQGHVAYPALAANPVSALLDVLEGLRARRLDDGAPGFDASNLEITSIDVGNPAHNVIPAKATAKLNVRFNTHHAGAGLIDWIDAVRAETEARRPGVRLTMTARATGEPFYTPPGHLTAALEAAVEAVAGRKPTLSTSGGTSDARFIKDYCAVAELGLQNATAHMVDERVAIADVEALTEMYRGVIARV